LLIDLAEPLEQAPALFTQGLGEPDDRFQEELLALGDAPLHDGKTFSHDTLQARLAAHDKWCRTAREMPPVRGQGWCGLMALPG
jgi:hypothetical protein